jgi:putative heme-binding domain-containing protein
MRSLWPAVVAALGGFQASDVADRLIGRYPELPASLRDRTLMLLCSRPAWASRLLDAVAAKKIDARDLRPPHVLQLVQLGNPALIARVEGVWGKVPGPGSPDKTRRIAEVRGTLPEGDKGNAARGGPVFREHCAVCHALFGEGEKIGPDLTGADRGSLDFLLTSLVDPSALIRKEYEAQTVAMDDGRVLHGLVTDETATSFTLVDSNRQKTVVAREHVEAAKASPVSLMPEGLLDKLAEEQIRDLFKYLQSSGPPR